MRVGLNLLYLRPGKVGGSEVYVRNLVRQLEGRAELVLFCSREAVASFEDSAAHVVDASAGNYSLARRLRAENFGLRGQLVRHPVDVLWSPANFCAPLLPARVPQVATVHDLQHHWLPHHFSLAERAQRTAMFAATVRRAAHLIAISDFTRDDLVQRYRVPPDRVTTVHEGVRDHIAGDDESARATAARHGVAESFFYYPAADHSHKNHLRLIQAFKKFIRAVERHTDERFELVFTGARGEIFAAAERRAQQLGIADRVRHLGFVPRSDVFDLLRASRALLFPSEFEGFGLPPLEAMRCETPVLASRCASIPEIVGDAALLIAPRDTEAWADAMVRIVTDHDLRTRLVRAGTANLARFSWRRCADETLAVLGQQG